MSQRYVPINKGNNSMDTPRSEKSDSTNAVAKNGQQMARHATTPL